MSACPQCGAAARPTDKFCNACGTPMPRARAQSSPAAPAYGAPAPPPFVPPAGPPGFGVAPGGSPPRCQMGHEMAPGSSYCPQGHPIALDQIQFSPDPHPGAGGPGAPPPMAYAPPPSPYGAPAAYATPPPPPPAFGSSSGASPTFGVHGAPPGFGGASFATGDRAGDAVPPKALRGFLVAYATNLSGDFWPLTGGRLTVGRFGSAERVDIALQDPTISSRHAALLVDPVTGAVVVEDTSSTNGTFVNDEHIGFNGRRDLRDGDRVRFGAYTTVVKVIGRV